MAFSFFSIEKNGPVQYNDWTVPIPFLSERNVQFVRKIQRQECRNLFYGRAMIQTIWDLYVRAAKTSLVKAVQAFEQNGVEMV